jgi:transposase-like protein
MVVKDEHDRIFMTHETASENGEDAKKFLQHVKDLGLNVTAALLADSQSFTEAIKAVWPQARFQADHFHTVKLTPCGRTFFLRHVSDAPPSSHL